jgi:hypothetical protein
MSTAWNSTPGGGQYRWIDICNSLGYRSVGRFNGNCDNQCGYCQGSTSCSSRGNETYGSSGSSCGPQYRCNTVHWECLR